MVAVCCVLADVCCLVVVDRWSLFVVCGLLFVGFVFVVWCMSFAVCVFECLLVGGCWVLFVRCVLLVAC